jgi:hypothetical protein
MTDALWKVPAKGIYTFRISCSPDMGIDAQTWSCLAASPEEVLKLPRTSFANRFSAKLTLATAS